LKAMTAPRIVQANGVRLCVQTFGYESDPALLLIAGAACSMDWWQDGLCERLADGGCLVIRYDHRDTGQSVTYPPGAPGYDGRDLVEDALGVLDALGVSPAHLVGMSMGGGIAQQLALLYPDRVASLALISSTSAVTREAGAPELPAPSHELRQRFAEPLPIRTGPTVRRSSSI
jgi:pimeloyl-ACP methyl ester carboxylesterase